jgi:hypothetical protein
LSAQLLREGLSLDAGIDVVQQVYGGDVLVELPGKNRLPVRCHAEQLECAEVGCRM